VFVDWLIDPPKGTIRFRRALPWLVVPVVYVGYSLVRGQLTGWYPYPFLNPATDGWCAVILTITGLVVLTLALTWALTKLTDKKLHFRR
jgi:hypothetical protein